MPRAHRICYQGAIYHIYQRGNNKQSIFLDDSDRSYLLTFFLRAKEKFEFLLHCYALMDNHFHATIETPNAVPISKIMQYVSGNYAQYFNKKYERKGHLFQSRFGGILVEKDPYLLKLSRYVHLNPVKAGFTDDPGRYKWSSYDIYVRSKRDPLVSTNLILSYFNGTGGGNPTEEYKKFVEERVSSEEDGKDWLEESLIRNRFLGTKSFVKKFQKRCLTPFAIDGIMSI